MIPSKHTYTRNGATYITPDYYKFLFDNDLVVDASQGGLISGPTLAEGGISLLGWNRDAEVFVSGQAEGWQFLINAFAEFDNKEALKPMSKHPLIAHQLFAPYDTPSHINVLKVVPREIEGELMTPVLFHSTNYMGLMPRVPARDNLAFLDTINRAAWLTHVVEKQPVGTLRESALLARFAPSGQN